MKKTFKKLTAMLLIIQMCLLLVPMTAEAAEVIREANDRQEFYVPNETSTWGDLLRHFNPKEFEKLPWLEKQALDKQLLVAHKMSEDEYQKEEKFRFLADDGQMLRTIPFGAIFEATPYVKNYTVYYWGQIRADLKCPYLAVHLALYDMNRGYYVNTDQETGYNTKYILCQGSWSAAKGSYRLEGTGYVTAPDGFSVEPPIPGRRVYPFTIE